MSSSNWSELYTDVLELIVRRLNSTDCYRFSAVCKSWRSTAMLKGYPLLSFQIPWLMLSKHDDDTDAHTFFSLFDRKDFFLKLPELRGKRCCGSSHGWLITTDHETLEFHLLNPFSGRQIELPSLKTFPRPYSKGVKYLGVHYIQKAILSKDPSLTDDYVVMAIFSSMSRLAFFRPQKEGKWVVMDYHHVPFQNVIYFKEQFYAVDMAGALLAVEIDPQPKITRITPCLKRHTTTCKRYLVEWLGELLHVRRPTRKDKHYVDSSDGENNDWNWDGLPKFYNDTSLYLSESSDEDDHDDHDDDGGGGSSDDGGSGNDYDDGSDDGGGGGSDDGGSSNDYDDGSDDGGGSGDDGGSGNDYDDGSDDDSGDDNGGGDDDNDDSDFSWDEDAIYSTTVFKVYKLIHLSNSGYKWEKIKSIGDYMLFLGDNSSFCMSVADFPESKGNRIYFTDDNWEFYSTEKGCQDLGIFNLEDGTFEQFYPDIYHSPMLPPIWITPNPKIEYYQLACIFTGYKEPCCS